MVSNWWPSGAKTWIYVDTFGGKRKEMRLGEYPAMKLAGARTRQPHAWLKWKHKLAL